MQHLSKVYRYVLENNDKTVVALSTEVNFISNYVQLLIARFDIGLQIKIELSQMAMKHKILPVTLQILIENAIKHNIVSAEKPLKISVFAENGHLVVSNNLQIKKVK